MSIFTLVNEIDNGEIVLPAIQRDFVWGEDRIELLFDSLFRGYPVGIVLLWESYQPVQFRRFIQDYRPGSLHTFEENREGARKKLVLDGQQRLSSIYIALKGTFDGRKLYYDVLSGRDSDDHSEVKYQFCFAHDQEAAARSRRGGRQEPSYWLRLSEIVGRRPDDLWEMCNRLAKELSLSDEDRRRMDLNIRNVAYALSENSELLKTQIIDSNLSAGDDKRKSTFDILEIFVRINTQGMTLRRSDLIMSMLRLYWQDASELLPSFLGKINKGGNLSIDSDFVIRCMFSTAGIGTRLDFELLRRRSNVGKVKASYQRCFDAIESTIDFVRIECGIDSSRLLAGINTLVPFVHYLFHAPGRVFPEGGKAEARRSLFLFAFAKVFTQHAESRTGAFIRDYMPRPPEISTGMPLSLRKAIEYMAWKTNFDSPDDRLFGNNVELALSLIQRRTGGKVQFPANQPEIDHIFPQSVLEEKGFDAQEIHNLGNLWILPREMNRNKGAKHPRDFLNCVDNAILETAMIDRSLLDYCCFHSFVRQRREQLTNKLREITGLSPQEFAFLQKISDIIGPPKE